MSSLSCQLSSICSHLFESHVWVLEGVTCLGPCWVHLPGGYPGVDGSSWVPKLLYHFLGACSSGLAHALLCSLMLDWALQTLSLLSQLLLQTL